MEHWLERGNGPPVGILSKTGLSQGIVTGCREWVQQVEIRVRKWAALIRTSTAQPPHHSSSPSCASSSSRTEFFWTCSNISMTWNHLGDRTTCILFIMISELLPALPKPTANRCPMVCQTDCVVNLVNWKETRSIWASVDITKTILAMMPPTKKILVFQG